ncbi:hypothetical protein HDU96_004055 [Phlyctochytrium bullatum]|nr:hypothetical protein HDU96_004055 [Phlyctochytrium bullatum]
MLCTLGKENGIENAVPIGAEMPDENDVLVLPDPDISIVASEIAGAETAEVNGGNANDALHVSEDDHEDLVVDEEVMEVVEESVTLEDLNEELSEGHAAQPQATADHVTSQTLVPERHAGQPSNQPSPSRTVKGGKPSPTRTDGSATPNRRRSQGGASQKNKRSGTSEGTKLSNSKPAQDGTPGKPAAQVEEKGIPLDSLGGSSKPDVSKKPVGQPYVNPNRRMTKDELDRKMDEMRKKNAEILKRNEAAEADARAFEEAQKEIKKREEEERRRRREELQAKREKEEKAKAAFDALTKEREENAQRKIKAMTTREWDKDKEELSFQQNQQKQSRPRGPSFRGR